MLDLDKLFSNVITGQGTANFPDSVEAGRAFSHDFSGFFTADEKMRFDSSCIRVDADGKHESAYKCGFERDCSLCGESDCIDWEGYDKCK
ncbi:MAG: hypothetical protein LBQ81_03035 [Zoogloeaceae bacterium]|nr:hypothetical protein [Zoogloeaceae bacterium]